MDLQTKKLALIEVLLQIQDIRLLEQLENVVKESQETLPDEVVKKIDKGLEDFREGRTYTTTEVKARIAEKF